MNGSGSQIMKGKYKQLLIRLDSLRLQDSHPTTKFKFRLHHNRNDQDQEKISFPYIKD